MRKNTKTMFSLKSGYTLFFTILFILLNLTNIAFADPLDPSQHQIPEVACITPVLPNVLLLVDSSGSMQNLVWEDGFDANTQYPLYRWGRTGNCYGLNCSGSGYVYAYNTYHRYGYVNKVTNGHEDSYDFGSTGATYDNNGAWYCYREHDSFKGNLQISSAAYIVQSDGYIYGRRTTEDNNWISGEGWRKIKLPQFSDPVSGGTVRYTDNYLAYLFETYTSPSNPTADLTSIQLPRTRMMVAREVVNSLIQRQHENARFALMRYNYDSGGYLYNSADPFGASYTTIMGWVDGITASTWTPTGESLYTAYDSVFSNAANCQYYCQSNFIVVMTDGEPAQDLYYPYGLKGEIDDHCDSNEFCLDLKADLNYTDAGFPWYNPCSNCRDTSNTYEGTTLMDGIAYKLNQMALDDAGWPTQDGEKCRNVATYAIGFAIDHPLLLRTAQAGDGLYYTASSAQDLSDALDAALEDIFERTFAVAGLAFSSPNYRANETQLVSTRFSSADWSGDVIRRQLDISWDDTGNVTSSGVSGEVKASDFKPAFDSVTVYTASGDNLVVADEANTGLTNEEFEYIKGNNQYEDRFDDPNFEFRDRALSSSGDRVKFGDIVHSRPAVVDNMIYVGGNDGFLYAIDLASMVVQWCFIPPQLVNMPHPTVVGKNLISYLCDTQYQHNYYVDLAINVHEYEQGTYLVGGFRGGAKGYFALDVTNPGSPSVLWARDENDWPGIGYSFSEPQLTRLLDSGSSYPVLVFGNGYDVDAGGNGIADLLFIVDLAGGSVIQILETGTATGGLSTPAIYGPNGWLRTVYAGDLSGNLWRFGRSCENSDPENPPTEVSGWYVTKLYSMGSPITSQPNIGLCQGKPLVIGGTGRYFTCADINDCSTNYIYFIKDNEDCSEVTTPWHMKALAACERVTTSPEIVYGKSYTVAYKPDNAPCAFGGTSSIYSHTFCPDTEEGSEPTTEAMEEEETQVDNLITSNLGTTADTEGNTAVIAEDVGGEISVFTAPSAPSSLKGWKNIRWQQSTTP